MTEVLLSRLLGQPVVSADGHRVGRLGDLVADLRDGTPRVGHLGIGNHGLTHLVPWRIVSLRDELGVGLAADLAQLEAWRLDADGVDAALGETQLLLARDVLDTQVVDVSGERLSRVSDVLLTERRDGTLAVVAVDVGLGALVGRMGLPHVGARIGPVLVDWADVHLASARGRPVQLATSSAGLHRLDPDGLAELLARLATGPATEVLRAVGPSRAAMALDVSDHRLRRRLMTALSPHDTDRVLAAAPSAIGRALEPVDRSVPRGRRLRRTAGWRTRRVDRSSPRAAG